MSVVSRKECQYDVQFFNKVSYNGFNYTLPEYSMFLINKISEQVGSPTYIKTPVFKKRQHQHNPHYHIHRETNQDGNMMNSTHTQSHFNPSLQSTYVKKTQTNSDAWDVGDNDNTTQKRTFKHPKAYQQKYRQDKYKHRNAQMKQHEGEVKNSFNGSVSTLSTKNEDTEVWDKVCNFDVLKKHRNEDGIQQDLNRIRICLNKITNETYDNMKFEINHKLYTMVGDNNATEVDLEEIGKAIFEIGSQNGFYSKLYARLFRELMEGYDVMKKVFEINYTKFSSMFDNIQFVDAEKDYQGYCENNEKNLKRRAVAGFMANLVNEEVIEVKNIVEVLKKYIREFMEYVEQEGNEPVCEEIIELLFVISQNCGKKMCDDYREFEDEVFEPLKKITNMDVKKYPSFTNKSLFKTMDLVELLEEDL